MSAKKIFTDEAETKQMLSVNATQASPCSKVRMEQNVISTGPYRFVRHPMYSGALLMMLFSPIALGSYWAVLCVLPLISTIILRLFEEEKFLAKNLPGYKEYCQKVRYHLIPFIW